MEQQTSNAPEIKDEGTRRPISAICNPLYIFLAEFKNVAILIVAQWNKNLNGETCVRCALLGFITEGKEKGAPGNLRWGYASVVLS